jgi:hypothetical protein
MAAFGVTGVTTPAERLMRSGVGDFTSPSAPLRSGHHHVNLAATAFGTDQPVALIGHGSFGVVPSGHLGGVGLDLMTVGFAPDDLPNMVNGSTARASSVGRTRIWTVVSLCAFPSGVFP